MGCFVQLKYDTINVKEQMIRIRKGYLKGYMKAFRTLGVAIGIASLMMMAGCNENTVEKDLSGDSANEAAIGTEIETGSEAVVAVKEENSKSESNHEEEEISFGLKGIEWASAQGDVNVYPATAVIEKREFWGFIDGDGKFVEEPRFDMIEELNINGMRKVLKDGLWGLADGNGKLILAPHYEEIMEFYNGRAVVKKTDLERKQTNYWVVDLNGEVLHGFPDEIESIEVEDHGLAIFKKNAGGDAVTYGIMNSGHEIVYETSNKLRGYFSFEDGYGRFTEDDEEGASYFGLIGMDGKVVLEPRQYAKYDDFVAMSLKKTVVSSRGDDVAEHFVMSSYDKHRKGFSIKNSEGEIVRRGNYTRVGIFVDGFSIVEKSEKYSSKNYGVINGNGEIVIDVGYYDISYLGNGCFSVDDSGEAYPNYSSDYYKKALYDTEGEKLTSTEYYALSRANDDLIIAQDWENTYFLNNRGERAEGMPVIKGMSKVSLVGDLIKNTHSYRDVVYASYYNKQGEKVWEGYNGGKKQVLDNGIVLEKRYVRQNQFTEITYPVISELADKGIQEQLNGKLFERIGKVDNEEEDLRIVEKSFGAQVIGDLLKVDVYGYIYPIGAAHGMPLELNYLFDLKTGHEYRLDELFKAGSPYIETISKIVLDRMEEANEARGPENGYWLEDFQFPEEPAFRLSQDKIEIYFQPYVVGPYAMGFPGFEISFSELLSLIDVEGDLWQLIRKNLSLQEDDAIGNLIGRYEEGMIRAINDNDFSEVADTLKNGSSLYFSQRWLVGQLNEKNVKERLVEFSVEEIIKYGEGEAFDVFVHEKVDVQHGDDAFEEKEYDWIYSVAYVPEEGEYKLTDLRTWTRLYPKTKEKHK